MSIGDPNNLRQIIKQQRLVRGLTLHKLSEISGVSPSHLGRIERGERLPSAHILRKIAGPLGLGESELFTSAGFLSPQTATSINHQNLGRLDPYVAAVLSQEPVELQRMVVAILTIFKSIAQK